MALRLMNRMRSPALSRAFADKSIPYSQRMEKLGRPVSPHVMIYAFPVVKYSPGLSQPGRSRRQAIKTARRQRH